MDTQERFRNAIEHVLTQYALLPESNPEVHAETIFDRERDHYLVAEVGWENGYRIYGVLLHVDLTDGKAWIQHDGTEEGIADELVEAGIPPKQIVLGFRPPSLRKHTDYAPA